MRMPIFLVAAAVVFVSYISSAGATTITTFTPSQVGFLLSDQPTINAAPGLEQIGVHHFGGVEHVSYLQFGLSGFTGPRDITDITLTMTWASVSQFLGTPVPINVYLANSNAWTTNSITWNNQPGYTTQLSSLLFNPDNPSESFRRTWTLSGFNIQQPINAGALSLALAIPIDTLGTGVTFKLNSPNEPALSLAIRQSVPLPSTGLLFGLGFIGLAAWRRPR
jgi:hypothetical protein